MQRALNNAKKLSVRAQHILLGMGISGDGGQARADRRSFAVTPILKSLERRGSKEVIVTFNHYRPARYLVDNLATLEKSISGATLDRFEKAFKAANALL